MSKDRYIAKIIIYTSFIWVITSISFFILRIYQVIHFVKVEAEIVKNIEDLNANDNVIYYPRYRFDDLYNKRHYVQGDVSYDKPFIIGEKITILYNPKTFKSIIYDFRSMWVMPIAFFIAFVFQLMLPYFISRNKV